MNETDFRYALLRYINKMTHSSLTRERRIDVIQDYIKFIDYYYKVDVLRDMEYSHLIQIAVNIARCFELEQYISFDNTLISLARK